jgi:hypothetical protein
VQTPSCEPVDQVTRHLCLAMFMGAKLDVGVKRVPGKPSRNGTVSQRAKSLA